MAKCIDVSQWQGNIDFAKVKASGINNVVIRAGYGKYISQKDPYFEKNYKNAKAAGMNVGVYWYSYAESIDEVLKEAETCLEVIKGKKFELPIYFDLEEQKQFAKGSAFCNGLVNNFCKTLERTGYFAGLYISRSPLQNYISSEVASRFALWIAEYNSKCNYSGEYGMWQYSSTGKVPGINGNVDMNEMYIDYPKVIKAKGLNGYSAKILDSKGYKKGDKNALAYKELLRLAIKKKIISGSIDRNGSFGSGTEKATNALLKKFGYSQNGIAGDNLIKKLGDML